MLAAIDIGSNGIRMQVVRLIEGGSFELIDYQRAPVRLGQDVFSLGYITEANIQATVQALNRFRGILQHLGVPRLRAVATSAVREAENSDIFLDRVAQQTGIAPEVISGEEEARLVHLAVSKAIDLRDKYAVLIEIGGGSVEVTLSHGETILSSESYRLGTVRLLQKFGSVTDNLLAFSRMVLEYAELARQRIDREIGAQKIDLCIGTGGNVEALGMLRQQLLRRRSNDFITLDELETLVETVGLMPLQERIDRLGLRPDRADVIIPAGIVLHMIARETRLRQIHIPHVGLKEGILWDMLPEALCQRPPRDQQIRASALRLAQKYQMDLQHGRQVARLADRLFEQSECLHHLGGEERLLLEVASLLHDIGQFIQPADHEKHGYYIVKHSPLIGFTSSQQDVVAHIIRYHRKDPPSLQDETFRSLPQRDRLTVTKLTAILRLADSLDTSRSHAIKELHLQPTSRNGWRLMIEGEGDLLLEKWQLRKRKKLFEDVFGVSLEIV
ncbi:MAG: Ppx/GppA phosphatase family protein [Armatimonadota bacterium]|nr:Ppx/GppA family phosphatase [bacterium]MDW8105525.1 Ppx/GppA phosphatase family protein [Armatimonadota bacterium]MDW8291212.1 Ppx/GppA phosphatase family protein [Armatimonadota bacterium]